MDDDTRRRLEQHVAGATVQHAGVYAELEVPSTMEPLGEDIIAKWVEPFYMWGIRSPDEFIAAYSPIRSDVSPELCRSLLTSFNWRPRITAAYFAAIEEYTELEEHIGRLFLRSDVCYSGQGYALALAIFNSPGSINFVKKYLDHYLCRKDLWFDQPDAMAALHYIDSMNGTSNFDHYLQPWRDFIGDKPNHDLEGAINRFRQDVANAERIRNTEQAVVSNGEERGWFASLWTSFRRRR
ncbi:MAG: DUF6000 family protein [Prosthecobacter sp.]